MKPTAQINTKKISSLQLIAAFFKLIRYPNLLFIFLTQYLLQYAIVIPVFKWYQIRPTLDNNWFFLLSFSTVLIAAAGYIINDYFDVNIDLVNKPDKVIVGRLINRRWAIAWYIIFNITGVGLGFLIAWHIGYPVIGFTQLCCLGLLWFYSTAYKRQLFIGNIVIALLTALTVLIVGFFEPKFYREITAFNARAVYLLLQVTLLYGAFAFIISMIRELVKDLEDVEGDNRNGCKTIPIVYGTNISKNIAFGLIGILIIVIAVVQFHILKLYWYFGVGYFFIAVQLPLIWTFFKLRNAENPKVYHQISRIIKLIMLTGILSMLFLIKQ